jgi:GMC family mycofactocin-associated oxidreductase
MTTPAESGADVIVVGAGSSGSVVAERLSRNDDRRVLWLEAGAGLPEQATLRLDRLPIGPGSDRAVHYTSRQGLDLPRGRGVGGSSVINGGYFVRWHRSDFAGWPADTWSTDAIADAYNRLDGGAFGGGMMNVSAFADNEIHEYARAFESHWSHNGFDRIPAPWPDVGVVRVRSNRDGWARRSAGQWVGEGAAARPNLRLLTGSAGISLRIRAGRVTGVVVGEQVFTADEVILCAGTLGTAELLARSSEVQLENFEVWEHREALVRFGSGEQAPTPPRALLQSVLHTEDGVELRCYNGDFADFIDGLAPAGPAFGAALMKPRRPGSISWDPINRLHVDLGDLDDSDTDTLAVWTERMRSMLEGDHFSGLVAPGSAWVDPVLRTSQHAWGTFPMGAATDWTGAVDGIDGLRILDASILPTAGSSGPHATVMMVATRIADLIA